MQNQKEQDKKILSLVPNMCTMLQSFRNDTFQETFNFFKTAFIELSDHEIFDEPETRKQWQINLSVLETAAKPFEGYSNEEMRQALSTTIMMFTDRLNRLENE